MSSEDLMTYRRVGIGYLIDERRSWGSSKILKEIDLV
jgi:hypothetical protein